MEELASSQATTAEDWKRQFQRETKVNKELGRRLRETKHQLEEEKIRSQELSAQILRHKRLLETHTQSGVCVNCKKELIRLNHSRIDTSDHSPSQQSSFTLLPMSERTPKIQSLDCQQVEAHEIQSSNSEEYIQNMYEMFSPVKKLLTIEQFVATEETSTLDESDADESNQVDDESPRHLFTDIDESSLGALFKYAVVLAGPTPSKPKPKPRSSFSDRFKPLDLQKLRNPQECMEQTNNSAAHDENRPRSAPVGKLKANSPKGGSMWSLKRQSQAILDNVHEDRVPSPLRRAATGFFSNLVPNGLRSAPSTPPLPPSAPAKSKLVAPPVAPPASKLLCVYPPHAGEVQELEGLLEICFPYGDDPPAGRDFSLINLKRSLQERHRTYRSPDSTFVLTIASASNPTEITYAICVRCPLFPDKEDNFDQDSNPADEKVEGSVDGPAQCCLCLLSPYPFFGLFFKVLYGIAVLWNVRRREALTKKKADVSTSENVATMLEKPLGMLDFVESFQKIMKRLKDMQIPSMGGWSRMVLSPRFTHLAFHRPHSASLAVERRHLVLEYAAPTLFGLLSVDQVLFLLGCLCSERKVLVVSDHVNIVSSCVLALITLLHPLQWAGPVITVLPPRLNELLEAPVPLIAGRVSINSSSIQKFSTLDYPMKDVIEMNMDQNALHMHEEDLITYHELKLPECDELVHELEPFSALLFGKHEGPDFPTVQQDEACKIMCARIHHHIESICTLAMSEKDGIGSDSPGKRSDSSTSSSYSHGSITRLGAQRRCGDMVADYINRFQETQMFSMFTLQAQDAQNESDEADLDSENDSQEDEEYHYAMNDESFERGSIVKVNKALQGRELIQ